ncbi:MAG: putative iron-regulated protein [Pseudohongiellaceae bacterium]|jgi:uncharacterized iron-regulated protein
MTRTTASCSHSQRGLALVNTSATALRSRALCAVLVFCFSACASPKPVTFPGPAPVLPKGVRELAMFDGASGQAVTWETVVERALAADVVIVGELHHHVLGLGAAAALFDDLIAARPDGPEVALEFIERDRQPLIDDFADGIISEKEFVRLARLSPSNYPPGHRSMVLAAVASNQPIWGANAPRRYVTLGRKEGLERLAELPPERGALVTIPETILGGDYYRRFSKVMHVDQFGVEVVDKFFRSQNIWDATMADTVVQAQQAGALPIVLVIGRFHMAHNGGTLQRIRATDPQLKIFTLAIDDSHAERLAANDIEMADVVLYAGPSGDG